MPEWVKRVLSIAGVILAAGAALVILWYALRFLFPALLPFFLAAVLSLFIEPGVRLLETRLRLPRNLSVVLVMLVVLGIIGLLLTLAVLRMIAELGHLSVVLPDYIAGLRQTVEELIENAARLRGTLDPVVLRYLEGAIASATASLEQVAMVAVRSTLNVVTGIPGAILIILVTLLATYFFSRDKRVIVNFWLRFLPAPWAERTLTVGRQAFGAFLAYIRAQLILVSISTAITIVGLLLIGCRYALTIGLLVGLFDLIPVLGPATIFVPWIGYAFLTGATVYAIKLAVLYAAVFLVRQMSEAKVVAANLGLHPLAVLAAMYIGLKLLGVAGLFLGPILLIVIQAGYKAGKTYFRGK